MASKKGYTTLFVFPSYFDIITVHAPHPPSPQPNLVPQRLTIFVKDNCLFIAYQKRKWCYHNKKIQTTNDVSLLPKNVNRNWRHFAFAYKTCLSKDTFYSQIVQKRPFWIGALFNHLQHPPFFFVHKIYAKLTFFPLTKNTSTDVRFFLASIFLTVRNTHTHYYV